MAGNDTGTWADLTRSTKPMWRSRLWTSSTGPFDTPYFINLLGIGFSQPGLYARIDGISDDLAWEDPDLQLPEGL